MKTKGKLLILLLFISLFIGFIPTQAFATDVVRQIGTVEELMAFANDVNGGQTTLNAELTADIDLTGKEWIPIGTTSNNYIGNFDGKGHRIKNMIIDTTNQYQAFFGVVSGGAVIENLIIDNSCSINAGAFSAGLIGGSNGTGTVTIQNCGNEANVTSTAQNAAGIIGVNYNSSATHIIKNCYNSGNISGNRESAAISAWLGNNAVVENCYNSGNISGNEAHKHFARFSSANFTNCYQLDTVGAQTNIIAFISEAIPSGELAHNLGEAWGQTIGSDYAPIIGGTKVYLGYNDTCKKIYSNTELNSVQPPHDDVYNNKGQCGVCGNWNPESAYITGLDLIVATGDMSGYGYSWNNSNKELTLDGLSINAVSSVGIKLPDGSKILLNDGTENNIAVTNTSSYGILCTGNLVIAGNGKLNVTSNGADAIRLENAGGNASLTIENAEVSVNNKINIPSTNKNSSLIINNSTVTTTGNGRNRIEILSGSESSKTEFIVKNSTVTCGFLNIQDTAKTGSLTFCVENSHLDAEMNETNIMSSAIQSSGKNVDIDITNSYIRAYTRCGAWGWGHSYAFRIDGTGVLSLNISNSDMLLYGTNRGLNVHTSGTLSSNNAIENCTIISYAKSDDGNISISDSASGQITNTIDNSIVFVYGNTQSSSTPNYLAEIIGSPTISYNFELPPSLGSTDIATVTPDLVLGNGQTLTIAEGVALKLLDSVSVKLSSNTDITGNLVGNVVAANNSIGVLFFDYGDSANVVSFNISGETVPAPTQNPAKLCKVIEGWYDDADYKTPHDFSKILTSSTTVYAKWIDSHSFTNYKSNNNATCTADGTKTATCDRQSCDITDTVTDLGSAKGHSFTNYKSNDNATCTVDGTKTATCDHQGCDITDIVTDLGSAKGHSFTNYKSNDNATCTADGTKTATCDHQGCDITDTITDEDSKLLHTALSERKNVKEATFVEEGYTGDVVCACGEILEKGKIISKKPNTDVVDNTPDITPPVSNTVDSLPSVNDTLDDTPSTGSVIKNITSTLFYTASNYLWFVALLLLGSLFVYLKFYNKKSTKH